MLTDIFARRYASVPMWKAVDEPARRLIVQTFQLLNQIFPFYIDGQESGWGKTCWTELHGLMARELGLKELSPTYWGYFDLQKRWISGTFTIFQVCEAWMIEKFSEAVDADRFIKERLSLVELGFRIRESQVAAANAKLPSDIASANDFGKLFGGPRRIRIPGDPADGVRASNAAMNSAFRAAVDELNVRIRQAELQLHYHNGFIQLASDPMTTQEVETPFWQLVADPKWKNVDHDMKNAIDLRDTGGRDPALYAARALESTIKIISDEKGLSTGKERGAHNYIDNLKRGKLIADWEAEILKAFFSHVRNPLGHGPGAGTMANLDEHQTKWAIETCMSWITSLTRRS